MIAYIDASAMVKFPLDEPGVDHLDRMLTAADVVVTSRITYADARAALARAVRSGRTTLAEHSVARNRLDVRWKEINYVEVTQRLVRLAGDVSDRRGLRGYDAVHLASALILGDEVVMATWDRELSDAASEEGLPTLTI